MSLCMSISMKWKTSKKVTSDVCMRSGTCSNLTFVFFLFCIKLLELAELGEFNYNQSSMTEGY